MGATDLSPGPGQPEDPRRTLAAGAARVLSCPGRCRRGAPLPCLRCASPSRRRPRPAPRHRPAVVAGDRAGRPRRPALPAPRPAPPSAHGHAVSARPRPRRRPSSPRPSGRRPRATLSPAEPRRPAHRARGDVDHADRVGHDPRRGPRGLPGLPGGQARRDRRRAGQRRLARTSAAVDTVAAWYRRRARGPRLHHREPLRRHSRTGRGSWTRSRTCPSAGSRRPSARRTDRR